MIDLEARFTRTASDRLAGEMPDVEALIGAATIAGTRIKRRRYAGATALAAAGVAAVITGVAMLAPSPTTAPAPPVGFAGDPSAGASAPEVTLDTFSSEGGQAALLATYGDHRVLFIRQGVDPPTDELHDLDLPIALFGPTDVLPAEVIDLLGEYDELIPGTAPSQMRDNFPTITDWTHFSSVETPGYRQPPEVPEVLFTIDELDGWQCSPPDFDKIGCTTDDAGVSVIQRPATDHDEWTNSTDKGGPGTGVLVSGVYHGYFVSIQPSGATADQVQEIADALSWQDSTPVF